MLYIRKKQVKVFSFEILKKYEKVEKITYILWELKSFGYKVKKLFN